LPDIDLLFFVKSSLSYEWIFSLHHLWLLDEFLLNIAPENNLPETSFFIYEGDCFHLRWFSPKQEVPLCSHATLAGAYIIFNRIDPDIGKINF